MNEQSKISIYNDNTAAIMDIREKMASEVSAVLAANSAAADIARDVQSILDNILGVASMRTRSIDTDSTPIPKIVADYVRYVQIVLSGGILTPLTGREEEWEDIRIPPESADDRKIICHYNGKEYPIEYKSVQVNRRYRNIFRFNKDNKYAHRTDLIRFVDRTNPKRYTVNSNSLRFIKFPYTLESVNCLVDIDESGAVTAYQEGFTENDLQNKIAFFSTDGQAFAAPPVPFYIIKREGIDYQEEIKNLVKSSIHVVK